MATHYKQLKETPTDKAGVLLELAGDVYVTPSGAKYEKSVVEEKSEFFALTTNVFQPAENEQFFYFDALGNIQSDIHRDGIAPSNRLKSLREFGNCFATEELAQAAVDNIKIILTS